ncbi:MAG: Gfo/Idh/MocA family oxidoreductase [Acidobacteriota bacterium]|nr:Gfo/Idh/MocA family oxidoreductase [Acidobacteriota bacterium]
MGQPQRTEQTTRSPIRTGIVGAGNVCEHHVAALRALPGVELAAICDLDLARAKGAAEGFGIPGAYGSLQEMATAVRTAGSPLDVVHVLTPPDTHAAVTLEALELGLHVLVEKPLATSVEDCDRIAEAARRAGKTVGVNHSLLTDPSIARALAIARSGALGDVLSVEYFRSSAYAPWHDGPVPPQYREGGYPFRDHGVHILYVIAAFLGEIRDVDAWFYSKGTTDPNLLFDEWRAVVHCSQGIGQFQLSWNTRPLENSLVVHGTGGVLRVDMFSWTLTTRRPTHLPKAIERAWHPVSEALTTMVQVPRSAVRVLRKKVQPYQGLRNMVAAYYEALSAGRPAPVTVADARPIVGWTEKIARAADERKRLLLASFPQRLTAKTLVTGASGLLGKRLLARLLERLPASERVRIMVRRDPPAHFKNDPRIEIVFGDLGDVEAVDRAVAGTSLIYHVGGAMRGSAEDFHRGTVVATRNVLASVARHRNQEGGPKLVYISSLSVLHWSAGTRKVVAREDFPLEPHPERRGAYTEGKVEAERLVTEAVRTQQIPAIILRPGMIFGPGAPLITGAVARRVGSRLVILGNGKQVLPLVYVDDVVDAILLAAERNIWTGEIFHLVDAAAVTQEQLARRSDPSRSIIKIPRLLVSLMAVGVQMLGALLNRPVPLSRYRIRSAAAPIRFDCAATRQELGWTPSVGVEQGLRDLSAGGSH